MGVLSLRGKPRWASAGSSAVLATSVLLLSSLASAGPASAAGNGVGPGVGDTQVQAMPYQVFAPYYEIWEAGAGGLAAESQASGNRFLSVAFLQTAKSGSCVADWNGDGTQPISQANYGADIAEIQAQGGNVIPSFGGYGADTTSTEIADSCTNVQLIAHTYESLVTTYHVSRIDMDVEANSLSDTAGIDRRNQAIALTEAWAARHNLPIQFSYTLPSAATGLTSAGLAVLQSAIANGARIDTVNAMTFDYWYGTQQDMLADTESAGAALFTQLQTLYPGASAQSIWHMIGITEMPGIDDYPGPGPSEVFTTDEAPQLLAWAQQHGIGFLSMWALQRDNGTCPGLSGQSMCSGVDQTPWYFSNTFEPFTSPN